MQIKMKKQMLKNGLRSLNLNFLQYQLIFISLFSFGPYKYMLVGSFALQLKGFVKKPCL